MWWGMSWAGGQWWRPTIEHHWSRLRRDLPSPGMPSGRVRLPKKPQPQDTMPTLHAVSRSTHADKRWKRYDSYAFAAKDALAPLVAQELPREK